MKKLSIVCQVIILLSGTILSAQTYDGYGGYSGIHGTATGQWHTEKINERHWFLTPEGNALYILGINHIQVSDDVEKKQAIENLRQWKFNTGGYDIPGWMFGYFPGFLSVRLHDALHWLPSSQFGFRDVFSRSFEDHVEKIIRHRCEKGRDNNRVIGYSLTDTPRYDLDIVRTRRGTDWVSFIRGLAAGTAGKRHYVEFLEERYDGNFDRLRVDYRLENIHSFSDLQAYDFNYLELTRPAIRQDDEAFLLLIAEKIYQLTRKYFDKYHPGACLLSEKFKMHDHPEGILKLAGKYFDVISIQPGPTMGPDAGQGPDESTFDPEYWEFIYETTGKPVFITDHGFAYYTPEYPRTLWHQFPSEEKAADFYDWYLRQVTQQPFIVGYMKCQYKSRYDPLRTLLKQGLLDIEGKPYPVLCKQVAETNTNIYKILYK